MEDSDQLVHKSIFPTRELADSRLEIRQNWKAKKKATF